MKENVISKVGVTINGANNRRRMLVKELEKGFFLKKELYRKVEDMYPDGSPDFHADIAWLAAKGFVWKLKGYPFYTSRPSYRNEFIECIDELVVKGQRLMIKEDE